MKLRRLAVATASLNLAAWLLHRRPELLTEAANSGPAHRWPRDRVAVEAVAICVRVPTLAVDILVGQRLVVLGRSTKAAEHG